MTVIVCTNVFKSGSEYCLQVFGKVSHYNPFLYTSNQYWVWWKDPVLGEVLYFLKGWDGATLEQSGGDWFITAFKIGMGSDPNC